MTDVLARHAGVQKPGTTKRAYPRACFLCPVVFVLASISSPASPSAEPAEPLSATLPQITFICTATQPEGRDRERQAAEELALVLDSVNVAVVEIPGFLLVSPARKLHLLQHHRLLSREFLWLTHDPLATPYQTAIWVVDMQSRPEITEMREIEAHDPAALALKFMELRRALLEVETPEERPPLVQDRERPWHAHVEEDAPPPWFHDRLAVGLTGTVLARFPGPELGLGALLHLAPADRFHLQLTYTGGTGPYWTTESATVRGAWLDIGLLPAIHLAYGRAHIAPTLGLHAVWRMVELLYRLQGVREEETIQGWSFRLELGLNVGWRVNDFLTLTAEGFIGGSRYADQAAWRNAGDGVTLDTFLSWRFAVSALFFGFQ